jgi:anti-sigma regulatory factor (Ser/Thr protein kinase)
MNIGGGTPPTPEPFGASQAPGAVEPPPEVWQFSAPSVEAAVPQARHTVRDLLLSRGLAPGDPLLHDLLVIASELVTNAVRHAALLSPEIRIEVAFDARWIRVAVQDGHPYRPRALQADHGRTGGRGLLLIQTITQESGGYCDVERTPDGGKVVWATLPRVRTEPRGGAGR